MATHALHLHDAAFTAHNLVTAARRAGLPWAHVGLPAYYRHTLPGPLGALQDAARAPVWDAWLALRTRRYDVVHVHTGTLGWHLRWVRRPVVLHLHGTDIRSRVYEPAWAEKITTAIRSAAAVLYSTPDLTAHAHRLRPDATYFPQPVDVTALPPWRPQPRVVLASRWEAVKGADGQLEVARRLKAADPDLDVVGLDWGPQAPAAAAAGVRLLPTMPHHDYLELLASASVVVGQLAPILSVSELEALGVGAPVVGGFRHEWYPDLSPLSGPAPGEVAGAALAALADPRQAAARQRGTEYVRRHHAATAGVRRLTEVYDRVRGRD